MLVQIGGHAVLYVAHGGAVRVTVVRQDEGWVGWQGHPLVSPHVTVPVCHGRDRDLGINKRGVGANAIMDEGCVQVLLHQKLGLACTYHNARPACGSSYELHRDKSYS